MRIPLPKAGRRSGEKPEEAPIPPPLITISHDELEKLIKEQHGVEPVAKFLKINAAALRAYCALNKVPVPNATERGIYFNNRIRVKTSRAQVQMMLHKDSKEEVAKKLNVSISYLEAYCKRHGLEIEPVHTMNVGTEEVDTIRAAITAELDAQPRRVFQNHEAMELVLSKAAEGLTEDKMVSLVEELFGIKLTVLAIKYAVNESARGRFLRRHGRIRLVGAYETGVDLEHLKSLLKPDVRQRETWSVIEALRCAVPKTKKGMSVEELLEVLPMFGIHLERTQLKRELKRLDQQGRITCYYNHVTIREGGTNCKLRVRDRDATPGLEEIKRRVQSCYASLADPNFTNVEKMKFILGMAPEGLWQHELQQIAQACGMNFKLSCIHSVVGDEAKGEFKRENGRVRLVGSVLDPRISTKQIREALPEANGCTLSRGALALEILKSFPGGLTIDELRAAAQMCGNIESRDTFRRKIYEMAKRTGLLQVTDGRVRLSNADFQGLRSEDTSVKQAA